MALALELAQVRARGEERGRQVRAERRLPSARAGAPTPERRRSARHRRRRCRRRARRARRAPARRARRPAPRRSGRLRGRPRRPPPRRARARGGSAPRRGRPRAISARAHAAPIPPEPPVTSTRFPASPVSTRTTLPAHARPHHQRHGGRLRDRQVGAGLRRRVALRGRPQALHRGDQRVRARREGRPARRRSSSWTATAPGRGGRSTR